MHRINLFARSLLSRPATLMLRFGAALFMFGCTVLITACGSSSSAYVYGGSGPGGSTASTLTALSVEPGNAALPRGLTRQFTATARYSDGTKLDVSASVTWSSSSSTAATINATGLLSAVNLGTTTVTATSGKISGSTLLSVSAATLVSIGVTPASPHIANGAQQQLTATGIYTDNSTQDISASVTWKSSAPLIGTISNAVGSVGLASAVSAGTSNITAALNGATGSAILTVGGASLVSLNIAPATPSVAKGLPQQFIVTGLYNDNSMQVLTKQVTWTSSNPTIAAISNAAGSNGLSTTLAQGSVTVTAALGSVSATTSLTVTAATLKSIAVSPPNASVAKGTTQAFVAIGTYSDATTQPLTTLVTWTAANNAIATVNNAAPQGVAQTLATGSTTITATLGIIASPPVILTVTAATLVSIAVTPSSPSMVNDATLQLAATGTYTDNSTQILTASATWISATTSVANVSNAAGTHGLATALSPGITSVTATDPGSAIVSPAVTVTVRSAYAYATNIGSNNVSQYAINAATGALTSLTPAKVTAGQRPFSIAISPSGAFIYVANSNGNNLPNQNTVSQYSISATDGTLNPLTPGTVTTGVVPNSVTIDPTGSYLYTANFGTNTTPSNTISQYAIGATGQLTPLTAATATAGSEPASVAINSAGTYAYVANFGDGHVSQFSIVAGALTPITGAPAWVLAGAQPNYVIVDPRGQYVYVANLQGNTISEYAIQANGTLLPIGTTVAAVTATQPRSIAIDATSSYAYVANSGTNNLSQYTIAGGLLVPMTAATVSTGAASAPYGVTVDATGKYLYVANRGAAISLFSINAADGSLSLLNLATATAGANPTSIATTH